MTVRHVDPRYFATTLGSHLGSAFSVEPVLTQSAEKCGCITSPDMSDRDPKAARESPIKYVVPALADVELSRDLWAPWIRVRALAAAATLDWLPEDRRYLAARRTLHNARAARR